jgi:hypothetical protein
VTSKRWVNLGLSLVAAAVICVGTWQVLATRTQLRETHQEVQLLKHRLARARAATKTAESALATAQRTLNSQSVTSTTTPPRAPFPFVDTATLLADLNNAPGMAVEISAANPAWINAFVNAFRAEEERETGLAEEGEPYYVPDPISEANAYVASGTLP